MSKEDITGKIEGTLNKITNELEIIRKILLYNQIKNMQQKESIPFLSNLGYQPKEIAELIDTTANTVRVALSNYRKKQNMNSKSNGDKDNEWLQRWNYRSIKQN